MTKSSMNGLQAFISAEWLRSVPHEVETAAEAIASKYGDSVEGVIFYGSCLRTGEIIDKILDFYVIVDSYREAYDGAALAIANKILPPNVFYHEIMVGDVTVRSKYAVLSLADLEFRTSENCLNVSVWARFCQPCMLLAAKNDNSRNQIAVAIAQAVSTMFRNFLHLEPEARASRELWVGAFEQTYAAELRSERWGKGLEIYLLDQDRYDKLTLIALAALGLDVEPAPVLHQPSRTRKWRPRLKWAARRWNGKIVSFLRLVKATATFDGGIDYLAWKISRHSGVEIEIKDWMRKHPIIAGVSLFWSLRKEGAFK